MPKEDVCTCSFLPGFGRTCSKKGNVYSPCNVLQAVQMSSRWEVQVSSVHVDSLTRSNVSP